MSVQFYSKAFNYLVSDPEAYTKILETHNFKKFDMGISSSDLSAFEIGIKVCNIYLELRNYENAKKLARTLLTIFDGAPIFEQT